MSGAYFTTTNTDPTMNRVEDTCVYVPRRWVLWHDMTYREITKVSLPFSGQDTVFVTFGRKRPLSLPPRGATVVGAGIANAADPSS